MMQLQPVALRLSRLGWAAMLCLSGCQVNLALAPASDQPSVVPIANQSAAAIDPQQLAVQWVVSPAEAKSLIQQGATVLDARSSGLQRQGIIAGSIAVNWQQFSQPSRAERGMLLSHAQLTQALRAVGISNHRPVVVLADPLQGWGEDGRIVWMLRSLGHSQAVLVDGGYAAAVATGIPIESVIAKNAATPGDFTVQRRIDWEITRDELKQNLQTAQATIIDVREPREFDGSTPYGEPRAGHIPGAVHFYYRELLDENGKILPRSAILAKLQTKGISPNTQIIAYCTAGVRAGWLTAVLANAGFQVRNYAGSMLDWASAPAAEYPLVVGER